MSEKVFDYQRGGLPWKVCFQRLLHYLAFFFWVQSSCVISFHCNSRHDLRYIITNKSVLNGGTCHFHRPYSFLQSTITNDESIENAQSETNDSDSLRSTTHIVFPGGGIFFYFQAGMVNFLRERYDLSTCTFSGASAGALTATLTAADVCFFEATELALKLAADAGVWDRSGGLQGIWGPMIEEWLDELLPASIDSLQERITLLVTPIPSFGKSKISTFESREDLIKCNMASVHLPWFLDGKLTADYRGKPHIDGSFLSKEDDYSPGFERGDGISVKTIILDWSKDPEMSSKGGTDIVEVLSPEGIYGLMERGKRYGQVLEDQGVFDSLPKLK